MTSPEASPGSPGNTGASEETGDTLVQTAPLWRRMFGHKSTGNEDVNDDPTYRAKSTLGILSDKETDEVPGTFAIFLKCGVMPLLEQNVSSVAPRY
jgi:hypothetical protein